MAYSPHILFVFGGALNTSQTPHEIWQCGIRAINISGGTDPGPTTNSEHAWAVAFADSIKSFFASAPAQMPNTANVSYVKVNNIGADGKYTGTTDNTIDFTPVSGTFAGNVPDMLSLCYTWTTARSRPPGAYGRVFLPNYTFASETGGSIRVSASAHAAALEAAKLLINTPNGAGGAIDRSCTPVVASRKTATNYPITGVKVGDVWDVQRRRKDAVVENYLSGGLAP